MYNRAQLERSKVVELKDLARSFGLKTSGLKAELVERLLTVAGGHLAAGGGQVAAGGGQVAAGGKVAAGGGRLAAPGIRPERAVIKSFQFRVEITNTEGVDYDRSRPWLMWGISWHTSRPLTLYATHFRDVESPDGSIERHHDLPLDDAKQLELKTHLIPSPTNSIFVVMDPDMLDDPNGDLHGDLYQCVEFASPDAGPLTQWQLLRGLEQFYAWRALRPIRLFYPGIGEKSTRFTTMTGLEFAGTDNGGIPIYFIKH